jgi:hypothetical protein
MSTPKSKTYCRYLQSMFRFTTENEKQLQIQAIRLYVLYEDMKLEFEGAEADHLKELEGTSLETRRFYFVRRIFGTLFELSGALQAVEKNQAFQLLKRDMESKNREQWDESLRFFRTEHDYLKAFRNDVGGHFLDDAAQFGLENMEDTAELFEIYRRGNGADIKLKFAYYFVAQSLIRQKNQGVGVEEYLQERAFPFIVDATAHAIKAVQVFGVAHLMN